MKRTIASTSLAILATATYAQPIAHVGASNVLPIIIAALLAALVSAIIVWLTMRGKQNVLSAILDERTAEADQFRHDLNQREEALRQLKDDSHQLNVRVEVLASQLQAEQQHSREALQAEQQRSREALEAEQKRCREAIEAEQQHSREALEASEQAASQAINAKQQATQEAMAAQEQRHNEAVAALKARFDETMEKATALLKDATGEMLRQRQREFTETSGQRIDSLVTPLRETIEKMKQEMAQTQTRQSEDSGAIKAIIRQMMDKSDEARRSTDELTRVFRHSNTVQGTWGETVLDELLQSQGLTRGIHYDVQPTIRDTAGNAVLSDDGSRLRPDVILHLDQRRDVIVDSKVSLAAYMDYVNATADADRQRYLRAHVNSLQEQVNRLATKDYSAYVQPPKVRMDYVIMFVPNSGALWTALNAQPDLWRRAMERGVYIADEQTLFAALRIISLTWTQIRQAENHEQVYRLAAEMMDRVGQFMKKYQAIGTALVKAQQAYDDGERKLQPSGQSILQTCAKLQRLGAKTSDRNPLPQLTDIDDIAAINEDSNNAALPVE